MHETREAWLQALASDLRVWFRENGLPEPGPVRIGVGYTSHGRRSKAIGQCWVPEASADGVSEIILHPGLIDPVEVGATLLHELVHAAVGVEQKHGPVFKAAATALGLTGRMTATVAGEEAAAGILTLVDRIGPYPHAAFNPGGIASTPPKQGTRQLKVECSACGYTARTTRKWLDLGGAPFCPIDQLQMEEA